MARENAAGEAMCCAENETFDAVVVGAALPACTCSTGCGSSVSGHGSAKPVAMLVALGTGIAICDVESLQYSFSFSEELD